MEMTGLDPNHDQVLEVAVIVTDSFLETLAEGPEIVIFQPDSILTAMDEWNRRQHSASGLLGRVRASRMSVRDAEEAVLEFLQPWVEPGQAPICGNSICQDRRFIARHMPRLDTFLHYRSIDVSTVKELMKRWRPDLQSDFVKNAAHRARADVRESIAELHHYRQRFFRTNRPP